jgi:hypothetical protein
MLVTKASFLKKNGKEREMRFVRIKNLTEDQRVRVGVKEDSMRKNYQEGSEVVYDLEAKDFRVFNWKTITGDAVETEEEVEV